MKVKITKAQILAALGAPPPGMVEVRGPAGAHYAPAPDYSIANGFDPDDTGSDPYESQLLELEAQAEEAARRYTETLSQLRAARLAIREIHHPETT